MLAPINTVKHYVAQTNTSVASGGILNVKLVDAVVAPATANAFDVKQGSVIKAVFVEFWIGADGATNTETQFVLTIERTISNALPMNAAEILNLGSYRNKKNIMYTSQGVIGTMIDGNGSIAIYRQWLLIPKGKQRFGLDDSLFVNITSVGTTMRVCGISIYKEYT